MRAESSRKREGAQREERATEWGHPPNEYHLLQNGFTASPTCANQKHNDLQLLFYLINCHLGNTKSSICSRKMEYKLDKFQ